MTLDPEYVRRHIEKALEEHAHGDACSEPECCLAGDPVEEPEGQDTIESRHGDGMPGSLYKQCGDTDVHDEHWWRDWGRMPYWSQVCSGLDGTEAAL